ncbi:MAG: AAA family ATPase, partial [Actinomycetota bacterium]
MMNERPQVQKLIDRGWQVVRLRPGSKQAFELKWPTLQRTAADFEPGENIGLRFGPESGGLVDLDLDYPTARQLISSPVFGLDHLPEYGRASLPAGQRGHRLVICPDGPNKHRPLGFRSKLATGALRARGVGLTVIEIRGSNGTQSAVPPSTLPNDHLVWTDPAGCDVAIPEMEWGELSRRVGLLAFTAFAAALYPDEGREAFCLSLYGAVAEAVSDTNIASDMVAEVASLHGDSFDFWLETPPAEGLHGFLELASMGAVEGTVRPWLGLQAPVEPAQAAERESYAGAAAPGGHTAAQLRRILDKLDPADYASYYPFRDLLFAAHHMTNGADDAREVFVQWSARDPQYGPGMKDKHGKLWTDDVRGLWNRAHSDREGKAFTIGTLIHALREHGHHDVADEFKGRDADEFEDDLAEQPERLAALFADSFVAIGQRVLATIPRTPWLTPGILLYGDVTIVAGRGGVGKSLHAWQIGVATVMGIPFPPWSAPVRPRRVLVLSGEDDADEIERRVAAACQSMGVERSALGSDFLVWTKRSIRLATKHPQSGATSLTQLWQLVRWAVVNQDIGLVIIDPLIKSSSGFKESDIDDMEELFGILRSLTDGYECAVLVDDHFAKAGQGGDQAGVRGASSKVDASRITITMTAMSTKEWKDIKPPGPPETYISIVDPKQNYGPKHASSWSQLVSYPVGNGEERPALQAVNLAAGQDFLDPSTWAHRIAFLRLIMEGRDEEAGQKGWPWCSAQKGPQGARLDCAMV